MGTPFANNSRRDHLVPAGITDSTMTSLLRAITCPEVGERIFTARLVGALTRLQETMNTVMRTKTAVTDSKIHFFMKYLYIVNPKPSLKVPFSGQPVSRILSRVRIYLDNLSPDCSSGLPGDQTSRAGSFSCLTLHRMGVTWPPLLPETPVVSYTTFSPLLLRAVCLCGPLRKLTPSQGLPGILLCGVRTFLTYSARAPG